LCSNQLDQTLRGHPVTGLLLNTPFGALRFDQQNVFAVRARFQVLHIEHFLAGNVCFLPERHDTFRATSHATPPCRCRRRSGVRFVACIDSAKRVPAKQSPTIDG
jgi:hypothetical protein